MKDLTPETLLAVFEEMFGPWLFWGMVVVAAAMLAAFVWVALRDRGLRARRFLRAELVAPLGGVAATVFVMWVTSSRLADIGGPIDVIALLAVFAGGAIGALIAVYATLGLLFPSRG